MVDPFNHPLQPPQGRPPLTQSALQDATKVPPFLVTPRATALSATRERDAADKWQRWRNQLPYEEEDKSFVGYTKEEKTHLWDSGFRPTEPVWGKMYPDEADRKKAFINKESIGFKSWSGLDKPIELMTKPEQYDETEAREVLKTGALSTGNYYGAPAIWDNKELNLAERIQQTKLYLREQEKKEKATELTDIAMGGVSVAKRFPVIGAGYDLGELLPLVWASQRVSDGTATGSDILTIARSQMRDEDAGNRGWLATTANALSYAPGYLVEIGVTGGMYTAMSVGARKGLRIAVQKYGKHTVKRLIAEKSLETVTKAALKLEKKNIGAQVTRGVIKSGMHATVTRGASTLKDAWPRHELILDANSKTGFAISEPDSWMASLPREVMNSAIEYAAEQYTMGALGKVKKFFRPAQGGKKAILTSDVFTIGQKDFLKKRFMQALEEAQPGASAKLGSVGWHGLGGEIFEERVTEIMQGTNEALWSIVPGTNEERNIASRFGISGNIAEEVGYQTGMTDETAEEAVQRRWQGIKDFGTEAVVLSAVAGTMRGVQGPAPPKTADLLDNPELAMVGDKEYNAAVTELVKNDSDSRAAFGAVELPSGNTLLSHFPRQAQRRAFLTQMKDHRDQLELGELGDEVYDQVWPKEGDAQGPRYDSPTEEELQATMIGDSHVERGRPRTETIISGEDVGRRTEHMGDSGARDEAEQAPEYIIPEGAVELDAATKPEVGQTVVIYHGGHVDKDVTEPKTWFGLDPTVSAVRIGEMGEDRTIHRAVITITEDTIIKRGRTGTDVSWHILAGKNDNVVPLEVAQQEAVDQPSLIETISQEDYVETEVLIEDLVKNDPELKKWLTEAGREVPQPQPGGPSSGKPPKTTPHWMPPIINMAGKVIDGRARIQDMIEAGETKMMVYRGRPKQDRRVDASPPEEEYITSESAGDALATLPRRPGTFDEMHNILERIARGAGTQVDHEMVKAFGEEHPWAYVEQEEFQEDVNAKASELVDQLVEAGWDAEAVSYEVQRQQDDTIKKFEHYKLMRQALSEFGQRPKDRGEAFDQWAGKQPARKESLVDPAAIDDFFQAPYAKDFKHVEDSLRAIGTNQWTDEDLAKINSQRFSERSSKVLRKLLGEDTWEKMQELDPQRKDSLLSADDTVNLEEAIYAGISDLESNETPLISVEALDKLEGATSRIESGNWDTADIELFSQEIVDNKELGELVLDELGIENVMAFLNKAIYHERTSRKAKAYLERYTEVHDLFNKFYDSQEHEGVLLDLKRTEELDDKIFDAGFRGPAQKIIEDFPQISKLHRHEQVKLHGAQSNEPWTSYAKPWTRGELKDLVKELETDGTKRQRVVDGEIVGFVDFIRENLTKKEMKDIWEAAYPGEAYTGYNIAEPSVKEKGDPKPKDIDEDLDLTSRETFTDMFEFKDLNKLRDALFEFETQEWDDAKLDVPEVEGLTGELEAYIREYGKDEEAFLEDSLEEVEFLDTLSSSLDLARGGHEWKSLQAKRLIDAIRPFVKAWKKDFFDVTADAADLRQIDAYRWKIPAEGDSLVFRHALSINNYDETLSEIVDEVNKFNDTVNLPRQDDAWALNLLNSVLKHSGIQPVGRGIHVNETKIEAFENTGFVAGEFLEQLFSQVRNYKLRKDLYALIQKTLSEGLVLPQKIETENLDLTFHTKEDVLQFLDNLRNGEEVDKFGTLRSFYKPDKGLAWDSRQLEHLGFRRVGEGEWTANYEHGLQPEFDTAGPLVTIKRDDGWYELIHEGEEGEDYTESRGSVGIGLILDDVVSFLGGRKLTPVGTPYAEATEEAPPVRSPEDAIHDEFVADAGLRTEDQGPAEEGPEEPKWVPDIPRYDPKDHLEDVFDPTEADIGAVLTDLERMETSLGDEASEELVNLHKKITEDGSAKGSEEAYKVLSRVMGIRAFLETEMGEEIDLESPESIVKAIQALIDKRVSQLGKDAMTEKELLQLQDAVYDMVFPEVFLLKSLTDRMGIPKDFNFWVSREAQTYLSEDEVKYINERIKKPMGPNQDYPFEFEIAEKEAERSPFEKYIIESMYTGKLFQAGVSEDTFRAFERFMNLGDAQWGMLKSAEDFQKWARQQEIRRIKEHVRKGAAKGTARKTVQERFANEAAQFGQYFAAKHLINEARNETLKKNKVFDKIPVKEQKEKIDFLEVFDKELDKIGEMTLESVRKLVPGLKVEQTAFGFLVHFSNHTVPIEILTTRIKRNEDAWAILYQGYKDNELFEHGHMTESEFVKYALEHPHIYPSKGSTLTYGPEATNKELQRQFKTLKTKLQLDLTNIIGSIVLYDDNPEKLETLIHELRHIAINTGMFSKKELDAFREKYGKDLTLLELGEAFAQDAKSLESVPLRRRILDWLNKLLSKLGLRTLDAKQVTRLERNESFWSRKGATFGVDKKYGIEYSRATVKEDGASLSDDLSDFFNLLNYKKGQTLNINDAWDLYLSGFLSPNFEMRAMIEYGKSAGLSFDASDDWRHTIHKFMRLKFHDGVEAFDVGLFPHAIDDPFRTSYYRNDMDIDPEVDREIGMEAILDDNELHTRDIIKPFIDKFGTPSGGHFTGSDAPAFIDETLEGLSTSDLRDRADTAAKQIKNIREDSEEAFAQKAQDELGLEWVDAEHRLTKEEKKEIHELEKVLSSTKIEQLRRSLESATMQELAERFVSEDFVGNEFQAEDAGWDDSDFIIPQDLVYLMLHRELEFNRDKNQGAGTEEFMGYVTLLTEKKGFDEQYDGETLKEINKKLPFDMPGHSELIKLRLNSLVNVAHSFRKLWTKNLTPTVENDLFGKEGGVNKAIQSKGEKKSIKEFFSDLNAMTTQSPLNKGWGGGRLMVFEDEDGDPIHVSIKIARIGDKLHLDEFAVLGQNWRGGWGTKALQKIVDLADKHGQRITLFAVPIEIGMGFTFVNGEPVGKISQEKLVAFYEGFGFKATGGADGKFLAREPQTPRLKPFISESINFIGGDGLPENARRDEDHPLAIPFEPTPIRQRQRTADEEYAELNGYNRTKEDIIEEVNARRSPERDKELIANFRDPNYQINVVDHAHVLALIEHYSTDHKQYGEMDDKNREVQAHFKLLASELMLLRRIKVAEASRVLGYGRDPIMTKEKSRYNAIIEALFSLDPRATKLLAQINSDDPSKRRAAERVWKREQERMRKARELFVELGYDFNEQGFAKLALNYKDLQRIVSQLMGLRKARSTRFMDQFTEIRYGLMLSGHQTQIVNASSNLFWGLYKEAETLAGAFLNSITGNTGDIQLKDYKSYFKGDIPHGLGLSMLYAKDAFLHERSRIEEDIMGQYEGSELKDKFEIQPAIKGPLGKGFRMIFGFGPMRAVDQLFKTTFTHMSVGLQASNLARQDAEDAKTRKLKKGETRYEWTEDDIIQRTAEYIENKGSLAWVLALKEAESRLFQDEGGTISKSVISWINAGRDVPVFGHLIRHLIAPFVRTPVRLAGNAFVRIPGLGFPVQIQMIKNWQNGDHILKGVANEQMGQIAVGLLIWLLSGAVDPDEEETVVTGAAGSIGEKSRTFRYQEGVAPPQAVKLWGHWYNYDRADPFAFALATVVDGIHTVKKHGISGLPKGMAKSLGGQVQEKTFFRGIGDLMKAVDTEDGGRRWVANQLTSFIPNLYQQAVRGTRKTVGDKRSETVFGEVVKRSETDWIAGKITGAVGMEPYSRSEDIYDVWGRQATQSRNPILPRHKTAKTFVGDRIFINWNRTHPDSREERYPTRPSRLYTTNKVQKRMSDKEYSMYSKQAGLLAANALERVMTQEMARNGSDFAATIAEGAINRSRIALKKHFEMTGSFDIDMEWQTRILVRSLLTTGLNSMKVDPPRKLAGKKEEMYHKEKELWEKNRADAIQFLKKWRGIEKKKIRK
jgi:GNAT superfamily N-acetyltransferase